MISRADGYGDSDRSYVLNAVPVGARRVLDVGCGSGKFLEQLKKRSPSIETVGIDLPKDGENQSERMDVFIRGRFPAVKPEGQFDAITFNDVLEHTADPWECLAATQAILAPDGIVIASIPNVRHYSVIKPLVWSGTWTYQEAGLLDRTHLRFFTPSSACDLFTRSGLEVLSSELVTITTGGTAARILALGGRWTKEFRARHTLICGRFN